MKQKIDIEKTLSVIKEFGLDTKTRKRDVVYSRMYAAKFLRMHTTFSLEKIGTFLGNKNHATILYYVGVCEDLKKDKVFLTCTNEIANRLNYCFINQYEKETLTWLELQVLKCESYQDLKKLQTTILEKQPDENYFEMEESLILG
ncbi:MAG: hypothetical protein RL308_3112 [Bacteroidota bacterium]|jgi:hypothetical protein